MHYALPRKSSNPTRFAPRSTFTLKRRRQLKTLALIVLAGVALFLLVTRLLAPSSSSGNGTISTFGSSAVAPVVLVTVLDSERWSQSYIEKIKRNREDYAKRHGYATFFANASDYAYTLLGQPRSWTIVPAVRHAMTENPHSTYFFHLTANALIMEPNLSLTSHVLEPSRLDSLMIRDMPVVPPDSIIKTFSYLKPNNVQFIVTQDAEDLVSDSFIIKQGDWGRFFLDVWYDPLYRSYDFLKAEKHALDHIVQWHATILAKLALVPQRVINAYSKDSPGAAVDGTYQNGDFVIHFHGCEDSKGRDCEAEMLPYYNRWLKSVSSE
ncbi:hypothetical protein VTN31DRAFT_5941 [Thermomyces dupontii]|uniref:uncharacterized protein n=1 Tax=Talaromyces thermophilus TaxID=28565 RepID=UPI003742987C